MLLWLRLCYNRLRGGGVRRGHASTVPQSMINVQFMKVQQLQKRDQNSEPPGPAGSEYCSPLSVIICSQTDSSHQLDHRVPLVLVNVKALQGTSSGSWCSKYFPQVSVSQARWTTSNTCLLEEVFQVFHWTDTRKGHPVWTSCLSISLGAIWS